MLATQNPIEQEGTYPLPEAQQDRFMFNIKVDYPNEEDEFRIIETTTPRQPADVDRVVNGDEMLAMQALVLQVPAAEHVIKYADAADAARRGRTPDDRSGLRAEVRDLGGRPAGRAST